MDQPTLPPVVAGRSALPAFLAIEAWARAQTAAAEAAAEDLLGDARAEAERVRREGEQALREAVVAAERDALRAVESRARDRVSASRHAVTRWIESAEEEATRQLDEALARICGLERGSGD